MWWLAACSPTDPAPADAPREVIPDPPVEIRAARVRPGPYATALEVTATTSRLADAAVRCVTDADPSEVFLLESNAAVEHAFRFSGLLPDARYACEVAVAGGT